MTPPPPLGKIPKLYRLFYLRAPLRVPAGNGGYKGSVREVAIIQSRLGGKENLKVENMKLVSQQSPLTAQIEQSVEQLHHVHVEGRDQLPC